MSSHPTDVVDAAQETARAAYAQARQAAPSGTVWVALHLGEAHSALAWGAGPQPDAVCSVALGLGAVAERHFAGDRLRALAIEAAIAEVEDVVMPWHGHWPAGAELFSTDAAVAALAHWAGMPAEADRWRLTTEAVEALFNRWAALAQGRPASQDGLPTNGHFSATLLVLREWLHHLGFDGVTVRRVPTPGAGA